MCEESCESMPGWLRRWSCGFSWAAISEVLMVAGVSIFTSCASSHYSSSILPSTPYSTVRLMEMAPTPAVRGCFGWYGRSRCGLQVP